MSISTASSARAQEGYEFEMKVLSGIPMGSFGDHIGQPMWGGSFSGYYHFKGSPFAIGVEVSATRYGSENTANIPGHPVGPNSGTNYVNKLFLSHVILRYAPSQSIITPYLEALVGVKWLFTEKFLGTTTSVPFFTSDMFMMIDTEDSETVLSRVAPSYGLGGGLKLRIVELGTNRKGNRNPASLYLNLQGRYLFGGTIEYLREGSISFEDDQRQLDIQRSRTDMLLFIIGISLQG